MLSEEEGSWKMICISRRRISSFLRHTPGCFRPEEDVAAGRLLQAQDDPPEGCLPARLDKPPGSRRGRSPSSPVHRLHRGDPAQEDRAGDRVVFLRCPHLQKPLPVLSVCCSPYLDHVERLYPDPGCRNFGRPWAARSDRFHLRVYPFRSGRWQAARSLPQTPPRLNSDGTTPGSCSAAAASSRR